VSGALLLGLAVAGVSFTLKVIVEGIKALREVMALWRSDEERHRWRQRQLFAARAAREIHDLGLGESWSDHRFAELEAEVEAQGALRKPTVFGLVAGDSSAKRRERSLTAALSKSAERIILLEGDPGSGKSVALKHVAERLATRASKAWSLGAVIPLYVNLKEFSLSRGALDANAVHDFVLSYLKRGNDRDIDAFLDQEFDRGLRDGTWLLLFDSFDEIPEILAATDNRTIERYTEALSSFLHGMKRCRGVIASRAFRGPRAAEWPTFMIMPLSDGRRRELVGQFGLRRERVRELLVAIAGAGPDIQVMASNPMFLGMLCDHVQAGRPFPSHAHDAFESYVERRLSRDRERLYRRHAIDPDALQATAEAIAFGMTAGSSPGLSPTRGAIQRVLSELGRPETATLDRDMDALEYLKLARGSDTSGISGTERTFTFAHRRQWAIEVAGILPRTG